MKKIIKKYKNYFLILLIFVVLGQLIFAAFSEKYTAPRYDNKIFFTTGIVFDGSDLHKLNEGAHYFGQTMIGWSKFPNFQSQLIESVNLPENAEINMHVQERQNMIFVISAPQPIEFDQLKNAQLYLESKIDEYNQNTNTQFVMTNVDFEQVEMKKSYAFGTMITLVLSVALAFAALFIREMIFPPKLKF